MGLMVRPATPADSPILQIIEVAAGEQFRAVGMDEIADADPFDLDELHAYADAGRSWVAEDDGEVLGYIVVDPVGDAAHVEQVSVMPEAQGRGIGRLLLARARAWAIEQGLRAVTLTTFRDVSWNAPLYAHLGFRVLDDHELTDALRAVRDAEIEHGLDPARRVCMRLDL